MIQLKLYRTLKKLSKCSPFFLYCWCVNSPTNRSMILASYYSCSSVLWVWAGYSELFLLNIIWQSNDMLILILGYKKPLWLLSSLSFLPFSQYKLVAVLWTFLSERPIYELRACNSQWGIEILSPIAQDRLKCWHSNCMTELKQFSSHSILSWDCRPSRHLDTACERPRSGQLTNFTKFLTQRNYKIIDIIVIVYASNFGPICLTAIYS